MTLDVAHITLDYTPAVHQSAGIGRLTREMIHALLALQTPHQFKLFVMGKKNGELRIENKGNIPSFSILHSPFSDRWLHRLWFKANVPVPVQWFAGACDLYHATDFVLPPTLPNTKTVLTVHDLSFERDPGSAVPTLLAFLRKVVPASARRATHIIADSQATARDLTELYGIAPQKITTIYSGVTSRFAICDLRFQIEESIRVRQKYNLGDAPFILTVGTLQPRKNHLNLVRAFAKIQSFDKLRTQSPISNLPNLVISGGKGWLYDEVLREVQRLGLGERVKLIGYADDKDLPALYRAASVFAFPSFYEGFGLPPLEAMACGVPVVTSNTSSLPEVVGDAGLTVNPHDVDALADALNTALNDDAWRAQAIARGLVRAKTFSWQRAAEQLLGVYENVLQRTSDLSGSAGTF